MIEDHDRPGQRSNHRLAARVRRVAAVIALMAIGLFAGASAFASRPYLPSPSPPSGPSSSHPAPHADDPNPDHC